ncbi:helix-turn-helix domain-containing protein [Prosthecodimorpha staleyi]|uniref:Chromosomal replication initiator DnaA C-terminal domain-containing protein n=1 Tax=Prosthecodimorpha staleyi TaxID=2840188 RepID=A0A947D5P2_9HYPH|nr:helix-turn-helix domain-containing protein [Prosthecodimorpha staleyi]MBT9291331.1 hypothetical protein [Prosthecodimorpha staleyi]
MTATVTVATIVECVSEVTGISVADILSHSTAREMVRARHVACWIAKNRTDYSLPRIGRWMGGRDHSTVLNAVARIDQALADPAERETRVIVEATEAALEIVAAVLATGIVPPPADIDPVAVAGRALASPRAAIRLTLPEVQALARTVLVRETERPAPEPRIVERRIEVPVRPPEVGTALRRLRSARAAWTRDQGGRFERAARQELETAIDAVHRAWDGIGQLEVKHG